MSTGRRGVELGAVIERLEKALGVFPGLCRVATPADARWKPAATEKYPLGAWSILEIACHMLDEETDDFRQRLRLTQENPASPWPGLDPEGRAEREKYQERHLNEVLERWSAERRASIAWLRSIEKNADWCVTHHHPRLGPISAGDLLVAWQAHDALHIRQAAKRLYELADRDAKAGGFRVDYAGAWGA